MGKKTHKPIDQAAVKRAVDNCIAKIQPKLDTIRTDLKCTYANASKHWNGGNGGWYVPGDWCLPDWWTNGMMVDRSDDHSGDIEQLTPAELEVHYAAMGHTGGLTTLPATSDTPNPVWS